jgi:hypothetical protein
MPGPARAARGDEFGLALLKALFQVGQRRVFAGDFRFQMPHIGPLFGAV